MVVEIIKEANPPMSMEEQQAKLLETVMKDTKDFELNRQTRLKLASNHSALIKDSELQADQCLNDVVLKCLERVLRQGAQMTK